MKRVAAKKQMVLRIADLLVIIPRKLITACQLVKRHAIKKPAF